MHTEFIIAGAGLLSLSAAIPTTPTSVKASRTISEAFHSKSYSRSNGQARPSPPLMRDSAAVVTGSAAVTTINDSDGIGAGSNTYVSYSGDGSTGAGWPAISSWVSFSDMFEANKADMLIGCGNLPTPQPNDSDDEINDIFNSIESIAQASAVDHRFILAVIMQESNGCVRVQTTNNGVNNPGLMQAYDGSYSCNDGTTVQNPCPSDTISGMIHDGAVGTDSGPGLATDINTSQSDGATDSQVFYRAARYYNSGSICSGDLSAACGATASYVSDIANRLTGWLGN